MIAEEQRTFVFADLAGYTALTEAHGDQVAADLAQQFCREVGAALPTGGQDLKSLGDACMVYVETAAAALRFAMALQEQVIGRPFPAVRVGMHTGAAVQRRGDWFGATVNVAARIAQLAGPNEILVSSVTRRATGDQTAARFEDLGIHELRHVRTPQWLFRAGAAIGAAAGRPMAIDPVCRLGVALDEGTTVEHAGAPKVFCSRRCADEFRRAPHRYPIARGLASARRRLF